MSPATGGRGRGRRALFALVSLGLAWLVGDGLLYLALGRIGRDHNLFRRASLPSPAAIAAFAATTYDAELGWAVHPSERGSLGERRGRERGPRRPFDLLAFGDSFTFGIGVAEPATFTARIGDALGWEALNLAVPGFGTDQAVLRHERGTLAGRYALLGVLDENIGRVVTNWWGFYQPRGGIATKPRFELRDGRLHLLPNPCPDRDSLARLADPSFIAELEAHDLWHRLDAERGMPERLSWPATATILGHAPFFARHAVLGLRHLVAPDLESETARRRFYALYEPGSEAVRLQAAILARFVANARSRGETPVLLFLPVRSSLDIERRFGRKPYAPLVAAAAHLDAIVLDAGDWFAAEDYPAYYLGGDGHFTPAGHARVAAGLAGRLRQAEAARGATGLPGR